MVKLQTFRARRRDLDFAKCALVAAVLSAAIVIAIEMTGGLLTPANAGHSAPAKAATTPR